MSLLSRSPLSSLSIDPLLNSPLQLAYAVLLALLIVYSSAVPDGLRKFADTLLGRILGILWIYLVVEGMGWLFGLFTAMAFLTVIYLSPHSRWMGSEEGFLSAKGGQLPKGSLREREGFQSADGQLPRSPPKAQEGFHGSSGIVEKERIGKRWFVERVLGEHPISISTEKVTTLPVQD
jgi:hypothetical protein